jgi:phospho-N-acetylmuramoyl-pentapeptide-transferase
MYIPNSGNDCVYSCIRWFVNWVSLVQPYPASVLWVIRSLTIGGIAVLAIAVRKELLIPLLCGVFLVENLSVVIQVSYFKYTKKRWRRPRIFLMAPLHHHYQRRLP